MRLHGIIMITHELNHIASLVHINVYMNRHVPNSGENLFGPENVLQMLQCLVELFDNLNHPRTEELGEIKVALSSDPQLTFFVGAGIENHNYPGLQALLRDEVSLISLCLFLFSFSPHLCYPYL